MRTDGQTDGQTNKQTNGQIFTQIFRDKLSLPHGSLDRYPLAPLGCKAVAYEDGDTWGSWASRGVDGWYLVPSLDHYRCNIYYISETCAYRISESTELFLQHCQLPDMSPHQHLQALTNEIAEGILMANHTTKGKRLLRMLRDHRTTMLGPPPTPEEQRVADSTNLIRRESEQRVINKSPIITIPCITDAPGIMDSCNPTAKQVLKATSRTHRQVTRNNTSGIMPAIVTPGACRLITRGTRQQLVSQHALSAIMCQEHVSLKLAFIPTALLPSMVRDSPLHIKQFTLPMVHPSDRWNHLQLQKINERSCNIWNMANCVWQGLWRFGAGQSQNRSERHQRKVCYDTRQNQTCLMTKQKNYLRQSGRGLSTAKGGSQ